MFLNKSKENEEALSQDVNKSNTIKMKLIWCGEITTITVATRNVCEYMKKPLTYISQHFYQRLDINVDIYLAFIDAENDHGQHSRTVEFQKIIVFLIERILITRILIRASLPQVQI